MGSDFYLKIGDIAQVFDGPHATPKKIESGPYFLSISSLEEGQLDLSKSAHLSEDQFTKWTKRVTPQEGDVLFSYETRLGEAALMPAGVKACLGRRMGLLRPDRSKVLPEYLLYAYLSPAFQQEIKKRTIHGATVERIALRELPDFNIRIPSIKEQENTVQVLNALNGKINLNRQTNQTLEKMAQTLFKSWFVDFDPVFDNLLKKADFQLENLASDFPDTLRHKAQLRLTALQGQASAKSCELADLFSESESNTHSHFPSEFEFNEQLGLIPKGWVNGTFASVANALSGHAFKSKDFSEDGFAVIKIKNIVADRTVNIFDVNRIPEQVGKGANRYQLKDGDIIMAMTGATVGKFGVMVTKDNEPYYLNQRVCKLSSKMKNGSPFIFSALNKRGVEESIINAAQGSAQPNISANEILNTKLLVPSTDLIELFNSSLLVTFERKITLRKEIYSLTKLRDTLLPKLISGELQIPDVDISE